MTESERRHPDLWLEPEEDPRVAEDEPADDERGILVGYLRHYRTTLRLKTEGLTPVQLAERSVPPSTLSLLGLVRHLAGVEHHWFRGVMAGDDSPRPFRTPDDRDSDFHGAVGDPAVVEEAYRVWAEEIGFAERLVATSELDRRGTLRDGSTLVLREVLVHMIEEYARHCGHADLLRERIDGRTGQ